MNQAVCPNGHPVEKALERSDDYYYCPECPYRDAAGVILGYGMYYRPDLIEGSESHE